MLEKELKTKLDSSQLDKETWINCEDEAASCLFNGVLHMYNRINIAKKSRAESGGKQLTQQHEGCSS